MKEKHIKNNKKYSAWLLVKIGQRMSGVDNVGMVTDG